MNNNETPRETLSKRKPLRFWGWGYDHEELTTDETQLIDAMVKTMDLTGSQRTPTRRVRPSPAPF